MLIASVGHIAVLYQTAPSQIIPLNETSYSVEVQLTSIKASTNSQEEAPTKDKDQTASNSSEASKALKEHLDDANNSAKQEQAGSEKIKNRKETAAAQAAIESPKSPTINLNEKLTHHINNQSLQESESPPKQTAGIQESEVAKVDEPVITNEDVKISEVASAKEKKASESSQANSKKSVKSEQSIAQPELSATEKYEAQIVAWILNGPNRSISSSPEGLNNPTSVKFTWWRNGAVIFAKVTQSSGNPALDRAAKRSVLLASPLPKIPDHITGKEYTYEITFDNTD
ncbi:hypothetical protein GCM10022277_17870 [Litoribacillus peritrichatus]|uniref:TonB C-terminal domain-containing protein n=2 Tax=Litoribacillus peritrichatus TaxID=718191 RepID=A0ABP7MJI7_9GAMM